MFLPKAETVVDVLHEPRVDALLIETILRGRLNMGVRPPHRKPGVFQDLRDGGEPEWWWRGQGGAMGVMGVRVGLR